MQTEKTQHMDYLDGWRGIAILLLLAGHFELIPTIAGHSFYTGRVGVECFFVLSGRLMSEILFVRKTTISNFYWRRSTRILPALWFFLAVIYMLSKSAAITDVTGYDVLSAMTFTINYRTDDLPGAIAHIWSLCVEEHAYILLSIIAVLHRRFAINVPATLWLISIACILSGMAQTWLLHLNSYDVYWHSDVRIASVLISAALFLQFRERQFVHPAIPVLAALLGLALCTLSSIPNPVRYSMGTFLLAIGLATMKFSWPIAIQTLGHPTLKYFGIWSFSLYLWQQPFYSQLSSNHKLFLLVGVAAASLASFYFVERPARRFLNDLYRPHLLSTKATNPNL